MGEDWTVGWSVYCLACFEYTVVDSELCRKEDRWRRLYEAIGENCWLGSTMCCLF